MSKIKAETSKGMHESNKGKNGSSGKSFYLRLRFEKIMFKVRASKDEKRKVKKAGNERQRKAEILKSRCSRSSF